MEGKIQDKAEPPEFKMIQTVKSQTMEAASILFFKELN